MLVSDDYVHDMSENSENNSTEAKCRISGRAQTSEQKRAVIERLLAAWERVPEQRLGQLIGNAMYHETWSHQSIHMLEDFRLVNAIDKFVAASDK